MYDLVFESKYNIHEAVALTHRISRPSTRHCQLLSELAKEAAEGAAWHSLAVVVISYRLNINAESLVALPEELLNIVERHFAHVSLAVVVPDLQL